MLPILGSRGEVELNIGIDCWYSLPSEIRREENGKGMQHSHASLFSGAKV